MAGGGPVTGLLAARAAAAAALLAGHLEDVSAVGGGGGGEGGIADEPYPWPQGHSWWVEVEVGVTGEKPSGRSLGVGRRLSPPSHEGPKAKKAEKPI